VHTDDWEGEERRSRARPTTGDRRRCPKCADVMRFYERFVVHKGTESSTQPAWVCRCGFEQYVRTDSLHT
jgi:hypothetical protein